VHRPVFIIATVLALSACNAPPVVPSFKTSSVVAEPIVLDVGQLEIVSQFNSPGRLPNFDHLMPMSPQTAAIRWAKDRLKPMGRSGFARVVIKDASVIKTDLMVTGRSKDEQAERYDGKLDVQVQILDPRHMPLADVTARATRVRSLPVGVTASERDTALNEMTRMMIADIDSTLDGLIRSYEARWVIPSSDESTQGDHPAGAASDTGVSDAIRDADIRAAADSKTIDDSYASFTSTLTACMRDVVASDAAAPVRPHLPINFDFRNVTSAQLNDTAHATEEEKAAWQTIHVPATECKKTALNALAAKLPTVIPILSDTMVNGEYLYKEVLEDKIAWGEYLKHINSLAQIGAQRRLNEINRLKAQIAASHDRAVAQARASERAAAEGAPRYGSYSNDNGGEAVKTAVDAIATFLSVAGTIYLATHPVAPTYNTTTVIINR